jgi:hypothetical protein
MTAVLLAQFLDYLAWLVTQVFALVTWKRNPKPSRLMVIALLVLLIIKFSV